MTSAEMQWSTIKFIQCDGLDPSYLVIGPVVYLFGGNWEAQDLQG